MEQMRLHCSFADTHREGDLANRKIRDVIQHESDALTGRELSKSFAHLDASIRDSLRSLLGGETPSSGLRVTPLEIQSGNDDPPERPRLAVKPVPASIGTCERLLRCVVRLLSVAGYRPRSSVDAFESCPVEVLEFQTGSLYRADRLGVSHHRKPAEGRPVESQVAGYLPGTEILRTVETTVSCSACTLWP
jgi:hypothetical protein